MLFGLTACTLTASLLVVGGCGSSPSGEASSPPRHTKKASPPSKSKSSSSESKPAASTASKGGTTTAAKSRTQHSSGTGQALGSGKKFPVRIGANGLESPKLWPDACKMLTDKEIRAVVPNVTRISRVGQHAGFLSGGETPHYSNCDYKISRPGDPYPNMPSTITVDLQGVAAPQVIRQQYEPEKSQQAKIAKKYPDQYKDYGTSLGGANCFWDGNEIQCIKGHFNFWVLGQQVTSGNSLKANKQWREEVLTRVIKTLAAKMS